MKRNLIVLCLALLLVGMLTGCGITVPRPEIKSGEFDFSVTYEFNGETKTVSGVYVCEYNGTSWALDGGYHRDWNGYFKGDKVDEEIEIGTIEDGGTVVLVLGLYPEYFMGEDVSFDLNLPAPRLTIKYPNDEDGSMNLVYDEESIEKKYGAKIISYKYAEPVENSFGLFK